MSGLARRLKGPPESRFWAFVNKNGPVHPDLKTRCWIWSGRTGYWGYGRLGVNYKTIYAHRFAYELLVGEIPEGLVIDHLCRNTACVNPSHLEPVSQGVNTLRGVGPASINSSKTHCVNGHPFDDENTYIRNDGRRQCRICRTLVAKKAQQKKKDLKRASKQEDVCL